MSIGARRKFALVKAVKSTTSNWSCRVSTGVWSLQNQETSQETKQVYSALFLAEHCTVILLKPTSVLVDGWMYKFITDSLVSQVIKGLQKPGWRLSISATAGKKKSLLSLHSKGHLILSTHTLKSLYKSTSLVPMIGPLFIGVPLSSINLYSWATKWSFSSRGSSSEL